MPSSPDTRAAAKHISVADPAMAAVIARVGPCGMKLRRGRYEALVRAIVGQQVSTKAAAAVFGRLRNACGGRVTADRMADVPEAALRDAGLSRQKTRYVLDLTTRVHEKTLRLDRLPRLDDAQVVAELTSVLGIGEWTAHMFLMFVLGRPDVLPVGDLGIRQGFAQVYGLRRMPTPAKMEKLARPWRPYRSVGAWYLWRALEVDPV